jgi:hypothetical protein
MTSLATLGAYHLAMSSVRHLQSRSGVGVVIYGRNDIFFSPHLLLFQHTLPVWSRTKSTIPDLNTLEYEKERVNKMKIMETNCTIFITVLYLFFSL